MTFYEAAVEVLRRSGRPLHYKKITEIAVEEDLLSHVGKTPGETMSDRLEKEIHKNESSPIDQKRPGVYQLDEEEAADLAEQVKEKRKKEKASKRKRRRKRDESQRKRRRDRSDDANDEGGGEDGGDGGDSHQKRRRTRSSKRGDDSRQESDGSSSDDDSGHKRRRSGGSDESDEQNRRRRRSRSSDEESGDAVDVSADTSTHLEEGPVQLKGIPRAAHKVLDEKDERRPVPIDELADEIFSRKLVKFHTHDQVATVQSALASDNQVRREYGHRPLFERFGDDRWGLTEWDLDPSLHQKEQAALTLGEEIRQTTVEQLGQAIGNLKGESLEQLALTLLERLDYRNIKVSKRSSNGDVFFTADWRQGLDDVRVCVQVVTDDNRKLQTDDVKELRETLDHYSASEGLVIHLGGVDDQAVEHGRRQGEASITLLDRETFVELLVEHGIGVETFHLPITTVDSDFLDAVET